MTDEPAPVPQAKFIPLPNDVVITGNNIQNNLGEYITVDCPDCAPPQTGIILNPGDNADFAGTVTITIGTCVYLVPLIGETTTTTTEPGDTTTTTTCPTYEALGLTFSSSESNTLVTNYGPYNLKVYDGNNSIPAAILSSDGGAYLCALENFGTGIIRIELAGCGDYCFNFYPGYEYLPGCVLPETTTTSTTEPPVGP